MSGTTQILAAHSVPAPYSYPQDEVTQAVVDLVGASGSQTTLIRRIHANTGVQSRSLAMPLSAYRDLEGFGAANDAWLELAPPLAHQAITGALHRAGIAPDEVDVVLSTTVTGIAVPSVEARIADQLGLREDIVRVPLFGLGCVAGAAGIARAHDLLAGRPQGVAVLLGVELCSLTMQRGDSSRANVVASGLFADGAGAVVIGGSEFRRNRPAQDAPGAPVHVVAAQSRLYPDTGQAMGWDVGDGGLAVVLGVEVPDLVTRHVGNDAARFLSEHDLRLEDIGFFVVHPGGPRVLQAVQEALGLSREAVAVTWESLAQVGNLSSVSVIDILSTTLRERPPQPGQWGLMVAMGPGFCAELVLLRCPEEGGE